ncbi:PP2C family protein-serine/threonine phosphatase [Flaviaesturariibacter amylovorans]|uniref:PPM-type phosphatase domain-containing protein n=1 Tax=Flaviaesturariibacter amylovorans TaxID=1084520 RepID=A0ABP8GJM0_9BACT
MAKQLHGLTDTGRARSNNEDAFVAAGGRYPFGAVIDGVGGYEGGEVAAALARDTLGARVAAAARPDTVVLREALLAANAAIIAEKQRDPRLQEMACVLSCAWADEDAARVLYAHVGDTRLYLFRDGSLVKLTRDHSFVGLLEDSNRISETEAMEHPKRNEIDRALGFLPTIPDPERYIDTGSAPFLPGDLLLLCSDGLTDMVDSNAIRTVLQSGDTLEGMARTLVAAANGNGGKDNITVVLLRHSKARVQPRPDGAPRPAPRPVPIEAAPSRPLPAPPPLPRRSTLALVLPWIVGLLAAAALFYFIRPKEAPGPVGTGVNAAYPQAALQDTLDAAADTLRLTGAVFGDTLLLRDSLWIHRDSLVLIGTGRTVLQPASGRLPLQVAPTIKRLHLKGLELRDIDLRIAADGAGALYFDSVRLRGVAAGLGAPLLLPDTLVTGTLKDLMTQKRKNP